MYRDDLEAAHSRIDALERELQDCHKEIKRLRYEKFYLLKPEEVGWITPWALHKTYTGYKFSSTASLRKRHGGTFELCIKRIGDQFYADASKLRYEDKEEYNFPNGIFKIEIV